MNPGSGNTDSNDGNNGNNEILELDTKTVEVPLSKTYAFLVRNNNHVSKISVNVNNPDILDVAIDNANDPRGAKYRVFPKMVGETTITVTYQGKTAVMTVRVTPDELPNSLLLDTTTVTVPYGHTYAFLVRSNNDVANIKVEIGNDDIVSNAIDNANDPRGAKYRLTTLSAGETDVKVTYGGQSATMKVIVLPSNGSLTLDTSHYTLAPGQRYTIGAYFRDANGRLLTPQEIRALMENGKLRVYDSRTGSILSMVQQSNGHFRVTAKNPGTCYIVYEIGGIHASVRIDVQESADANGTAVRNTSYYTQQP